MKIQVSPFLVKSVPIGGGGKRCRRKRPGTVLASFPVQPRNATKQQQQQQGDGPLLTVTTSHRVTVLERSVDGSSLLSEPFQIAVRPSPAGAFLDETHPIAPVVVVSAHKESVVYALQSNNTKLVCYPSLEESQQQQQQQNVSTLLLESPALTLSLLHLPMDALVVVYGCCQDGRVYVATTHDDQKLVSLDYIVFDKSSSALQTETVPIHAVMQVVGNDKNNNKKRKLSSEYQLRVVQCLGTNRGLCMVQKTVRMVHGKVTTMTCTASDKNADNNHGPQQKTIVVPFVNDDKRVVMASNLSIQYNQKDTISVCFSTKPVVNGKTTYETEYVCAFLSLHSGRVVAAPMTLPSSTLSTGWVGPSLLAVATLDQQLLLYDTCRGAVLYAGQPGVFCENTNPCKIRSMVCDAAHSRIALVLATSDDEYRVGWSQVVVTDNNNTGKSRNRVLQKRKLSLALGLESALLQQTKVTTKPTFSLSDPVLSALRTNGDPVANGLRLLEGAFEMVRFGSAKISKAHFLRQVFCSALEAVLPLRESVQDNPQDSTPPVKKQKSSDANGVNGVNGILPFVVLLPKHQTPQTFVDYAVSSVVDLLCQCDAAVFRLGSIGEDLGWILKQLVRCGQVSARVHFGERYLQLLETLEMTGDGSEATYSAFELVMDSYRLCSDLSELQMVSGVRFVMTTTQTQHLARFFEGHRKEHVDESFYERCARFATLGAKSKSDKDRLKEERRIVLSSSAVLLHRIANCSKYNESLMRHAFVSILGKEGIAFLCRLLASLNSESDQLQGSRTVVDSGGLLKLLSLLCDCCGNPSDSAALVDVRNWVKGEMLRQKTYHFLRQAVREALERKKAKKKNNANEQKSKPSILPGYQIERLVF